MKIVELPTAGTQDVPSALRSLADAIEAGRYHDAHNVAWVVDCGNGIVECGMAGRSASPGAEAHMLFALAQRKIELL